MGDQMQAASESECRPIGATCPGATAWPTEPTLRERAPGFEGDVLYMLATAPAGAIVALGLGDYPEWLRSETAVAIVGACVDGVRVAAPNRGEASLDLDLAGTGGQLVRDLTLAADAPRTLGALVRVEGQPVSLRSILVTGTDHGGIVFQGEQAGSLSDVVVREPGGQGLEVREGARVQAERLVVEAAGGTGVFVNRRAGDARSTLTLSDAVVSGPGRQGIEVARGSSADLAQVIVREAGRASLAGITVDSETPTEVTGADLFLAHPTGLGRTWLSHGIEVDGGGVLDVRRVRIEGALEAGVFVASYVNHREATVRMSDVLIRGTLPSRDTVLGMALALLGPSDVALERALLLESRGVAVAVSSVAARAPATLSLTDVVVADNQSSSDRKLGWGLALMEGAQGQAERLLIDRPRAAGVLVAGWGKVPETRLSLAHVTVRDTRQPECTEIPEGEAGSCVVGGALLARGSGVVIHEGGRLKIEDFELTGSAVAGLFLGPEGHITARRGDIRDNEIGLNFLQEDFDLDSLSDDVRVFDNGTDVARQELPLPSTEGLFPARPPQQPAGGLAGADLQVPEHGEVLVAPRALAPELQIDVAAHVGPA